MVDIIIGDHKILSFVDEKTDNNTTFTRTIGESKYIYENGVKVYSEHPVKTRYTCKRKKDISIKNNFITRDF